MYESLLQRPRSDGMILWGLETRWRSKTTFDAHHGCERAAQVRLRILPSLSCFVLLSRYGLKDNINVSLFIAWFVNVESCEKELPFSQLVQK